MNSLRRNVRQWWQPPKNIMDREEERQVTFLEPFYSCSPPVLYGVTVWVKLLDAKEIVLTELRISQ